MNLERAFAVTESIHGDHRAGEVLGVGGMVEAGEGRHSEA